MTEQNDAILVRQCLEGNAKAFESIIDKYQKTIFNLTLRMLGNRDDAEDIAQNVFIKAYEKLAAFDPKYKFFSWLYRMAINEALNLRNQRKRFDALDDGLVAGDKTPVEDYEEHEMTRYVESAMRCLDAEHRALIVLKHFQHLAYQEISDIMGIPEKTVKSRLYAARQALKNVLLNRGFVAND